MGRLTHKRVGGMKYGYWTECKKDDITQRLGEYKDTELSPEEIMALKNQSTSATGDFLKELETSLDREVRHGMKSYTSKVCFIAEALSVSPDEITFTAGDIRKALELAKKKSA